MSSWVEYPVFSYHSVTGYYCPYNRSHHVEFIRKVSLPPRTRRCLSIHGGGGEGVRVPLPPWTKPGGTPRQDQGIPTPSRQGTPPRQDNGVLPQSRLGVPPGPPCPLPCPYPQIGPGPYSLRCGR